MFQSQHSHRILTQVEHSKLSGLLAWHWGNRRFDRPALDFFGFASGVTLHDWHYGPMDNHPLGDTPPAAWQEIAERGVTLTYDDPVTDLVAKYHLRRLIGDPEDATTRALVGRLDAHIATQLEAHRLSASAFAWADRITRFCDEVAFHFGFDHRGWHRSTVVDRLDTSEETEIAYEINDSGVLRFDPWPFAATEFGMPLIVFDGAGYPERPSPYVLFVQGRKLG
ncbi:DUF3891 family protein [Salinisphaera sp.]|uniref:DUF3891 family protein n=1 Tax=Salinisphaera sp. TaxID=1914330 RepID=UPI002D7852E2|nr:DUF3891 family protein [Salinisphaera sp.]HET7313550.1 DUF3891 family protein [Salinisphaera sp.]